MARELADGRTASLGRARLLGNTSIEQKFPLKGLKEAPKRAIVELQLRRAGFQLEHGGGYTRFRPGSTAKLRRRILKWDGDPRLEIPQPLLRHRAA